MTGAGLIYRTVWAHVHQDHVLGMSGHCAHITIYGNIGKPLMRDAHTAHREATLYGSHRTVEFYNVSIVIRSMHSTE
jgi:hypothetical protein